MKVIQKYIIKEMIGPFLAGFVLFTVLFLSDKANDLIDIAVNYNIDFLTFFKLFLFTMPAYIALTMPIGVLVGVMMSFNRLNSDNEILAVKTSGISIKTLLYPIIILSVILSFVMVGWNNYVLSWSNESYKNLFYKITSEHATLALQQKVFVSSFDNFVFYIDEKDDKTNTLKNISVYSMGKDNETPYIITAKYGYIFSDPKEKAVYLKLEDGLLHQINSKDKTLYSRIKFNSYSINLDLKGNISSNVRTAQEMNLPELSAEIKRMFNNGFNTNTLRIEFHKKISIPFACISFAILGIALGISIKIKSRAISFIISVGLIVFYYIMLIIGDILGTSGYLEPWFAIWLPNFVIFIIGSVLLYLTVWEKIQI